LTLAQKTTYWVEDFLNFAWVRREARNRRAIGMNDEE